MTDTFCSDIVALFFNHIWECPNCLDKVFGFLLGFFVIVGFITSLICLIVDLLFSLTQKIAYRRSYKEKYDVLQREYSELHSNFIVLSDEYLKLKNQ